MNQSILVGKTSFFTGFLVSESLGRDPADDEVGYRPKTWPFMGRTFDIVTRSASEGDSAKK